MRKKVTALMLAMVMILTMPMAIMADEGNEITGYRMVVEGFDWGPGVTSITLEFSNALESVDVEDFEVSLYRQAGFFMPGFPEEAVIEDAMIVDAELSQDGYSVTLQMVVHPENGINPFTFSMDPGVSMGNAWSDPFETIIIWQGETFTPPRIEMALPLTDLFDLSGTFAYEGITLQYASFAPSQAGDRPLIIWLHGGGEGSLENTVDPDIIILGNRVTQLVGPEIQGIMGGAHVFLPQSPTMWLNGTDGRGEGATGYVSNYESALLALIDQFIADTPNIDTNRIYIGGCSNGGYMALRMLFERPHLYAAAWPVCILYDPDWVSDEKVQSIVHIPIWFVHDINDPTTPHEHAQNLYDLLIAAGAENVHLYTTDGLYSDVHLDEDGNPHRFNDHWSWIPALNNTVSGVIDGQQMSLFEWMAAQSLDASPADEEANADEAIVEDGLDDVADAGDIATVEDISPVETVEYEETLPAVVRPIDTVERRTVDGVDFVPFRLVAEAYGASVEWDGENQAVITTSATGNVWTFVVAEVGGFNDNGTIFVPFEYASGVFY